MLDEMRNDRRRFVLGAGSFAALALAAGLAAGRAAAEAPVRLNETQVIGTHNSYHVQADKRCSL